MVDSTEYITAYRRKRDLEIGILSSKFRLALLDNAFYMLAKTPNYHNGDQFVDLAFTEKLSSRSVLQRASYAFPHVLKCPGCQRRGCVQEDRLMPMCIRGLCRARARAPAWC